MTERTQQAFPAELPSTLAPFAALPEVCRDLRLIEGAELVEALVASSTLEVLSELGIEPGALDATVAALADRAGVVEDRRAAFSWLLRNLAHRGLLDLDGDVAGALRPSPWSRAELERAQVALSATVSATAALIQRSAEGYPAFLRGQRLGMQVLFGAESLPLWEAYFSNANPFNHAFNALAAYAASEATADREGLRVLEVGGGCGSSGQSLLEALGSRVAAYTYSEVAPVLLVRGRRALQASFPGAALRFERVDIDRPLTDQRIGANSFDLIYAVNTLHVARDLVASLEALRGALAPRGVLVLGEATRPAPGQPIGFEFVFQLAEGFRRFRPIEGLREEPGFLGWAPWLEVLERAGFKDARTVPDMRAALAAYPKHTICALVASA